MRNLNVLVASLVLATADVSIVFGAMESVGSKLCNTNDDQVVVAELVQSVDATIFGYQETIAAGQQRFMVGNTLNGVRRGLLKFMVNGEEEALPSDARIECAEIRLFLTQSDDERRTIPVPEINLYRVTSDWSSTDKNELQLNGLNGGTANPGDTTWRYSNYPSDEWENEGGDFKTELLARNVLMGDLHWYGNTPEMAAAVQSMSDNPYNNYGFILISSDEGDESAPSYSRYNGIESSPELIPRMIVTYTSPRKGKPHLTKTDDDTPADSPLAPADASMAAVSSSCDRTGAFFGYLLPVLFFGSVVLHL